MLTISLSDNALRVHIPSPSGLGHHVTIPLSVGGLTLLRDILQAREKEERSLIGSKGSPTQHDIRIALTALRAQTAEAERQRLMTLPPESPKKLLAIALQI